MTPPGTEAAEFLLPLDLPLMEARLVDELPEDPGWQFEPKWDGFRCLAFRAGDRVELRAKSGKPLARYFPEMAAVLRGLEQSRFVLDGELAIPLGETFSFDALQMRLHPAESRIRKLAVETPAVLILFDLLAGPSGEILLQAPLVERRIALDGFFGSIGPEASLRLSPFTRNAGEARRWLDASGGALDGVIAKRLDGAYQPGERAMLKIKKRRTADCVVGGFRYERNSRLVGSLLLGLYNGEGKLDHVGFTATLHSLDRKALTERLEGLIMPPGHRQCTRGTQPVEHGAFRRLAAGAARIGRRGAIRSRQRRPLPARHPAVALAARQGARAMHFRAGRTRSRRGYGAGSGGSGRGRRFSPIAT